MRIVEFKTNEMTLPEVYRELIGYGFDIVNSEIEVQAGEFKGYSRFYEIKKDGKMQY